MAKASYEFRMETNKVPHKVCSAWVPFRQGNISIALIHSWKQPQILKIPYPTRPHYPTPPLLSYPSPLSYPTPPSLPVPHLLSIPPNFPFSHPSRLFLPDPPTRPTPTRPHHSFSTHPPSSPYPTQLSLLLPVLTLPYPTPYPS